MDEEEKVEGKLLPSTSRSSNSLQFERVCDLLEEIVGPKLKPAEKLRQISDFLAKHAKSNEDAYAILRTLLPQLDSDRISFKLKEVSLARIYTEILGLPRSEGDHLKFYKYPFRQREDPECAAGDFGSVLYSILKTRIHVPPENLQLVDLHRYLDVFHDSIGGKAKKSAFLPIATNATAKQQKWIARIILKDMKIGVGYERILRCVHPTAVRLYNESQDLKAVLESINIGKTANSKVDKKLPISGAILEGAGTLEDERLKTLASAVFPVLTIFQRIKPMLAKGLTADKAYELFDATCMSNSMEEADSEEFKYLMEEKYDGERMICHIDKQADQQIGLYTRRGKDYSTKYLSPKFRSLLLQSFKGLKVILDGEILSWDEGLGEFMPFGANRFVSRQWMHEDDSKHLCYIVFDVLFYENTKGKAYNLSEMILSERKELLAKILTQQAHYLELAPYQEVRSAAQVLSQLDRITQMKKEGLMLKSVSSKYRLNARNGGWFKLKPALGSLQDTLDLLVVGAYLGSSRRRISDSACLVDHCTSFLLGVIEDAKREENDVKVAEEECLDVLDTPEEEEVKNSKHSQPGIVTICKIGTGYSADELDELRRLIKETSWCTYTPDIPWLHWRPQAADVPDIVWPPSEGFVMEVKAAEIISSSSFSAGYSLRFPRVVKHLRSDLCWNEGWSLSRLKDFIPKATKAVDLDSEDDQFSTTFEADELSKRSPYAAQVSSSPSLTPPRNSTLTSVPSSASSSSVRTSVSRRKALSSCWQQAVNIEADEVVSDIFHGMEFNVTNGDCDYLKNDIEILILKNGGTCTQSYRPFSRSMLIGTKQTFRSSHLANTYKLSIIHSKWILECHESSSLINLLPTHFVRMASEVEGFFSQFYDAFGDSFFTASNSVSLMRDTLSRVDLNKESVGMEALESTDDRVTKLEGDRLSVCDATLNLRRKLNTVSTFEGISLGDGVKIQENPCSVINLFVEIWDSLEEICSEEMNEQSEEPNIFNLIESAVFLAKQSEAARILSLLHLFRLLGGRITRELHACTHRLIVSGESSESTEETQPPTVNLAWIEALVGLTSEDTTEEKPMLEQQKT